MNSIIGRGRHTVTTLLAVLEPKFEFQNSCYEQRDLHVSEVLSKNTPLAAINYNYNVNWPD